MVSSDNVLPADFSEGQSGDTELAHILAQAGLQWAAVSAKAKNFLGSVIACARAGDELKTLEALSSLFQTMDVGKAAGHSSRLFLATCQLLESKNLLPTEFLPLGAMSGADHSGARHAVLTEIGLASTHGPHLYSTDTEFDILEEAENIVARESTEKSPNGGSRLLGKLASSLGAGVDSPGLFLVVKDLDWTVRIWFARERQAAIQRLVTRLSGAIQSGLPSGHGERDLVGELERAKKLHESGALSDEEFRVLKENLLG
jgi:hypothetical protein